MLTDYYEQNNEGLQTKIVASNWAIIGIKFILSYYLCTTKECLKLKHKFAPISIFIHSFVHKIEAQTCFIYNVKSSCLNRSSLRQINDDYVH